MDGTGKPGYVVMPSVMTWLRSMWGTPITVSAR